MYDIEVKKYLLFCVFLTMNKIRLPNVMVSHSKPPKRKRTKGNTLIYKTASPVLVLNTNIIRDFSYIRNNVVVRLPISCVDHWFSAICFFFGYSIVFTSSNSDFWLAFFCLDMCSTTWKQIPENQWSTNHYTEHLMSSSLSGFGSVSTVQLL
jgi:hypothetical protein